MSWLGTIAREVVGLFVDDGSFALQIIVWLVAMYALSHVVHRPMAEALLLFAGLAVLLALTVLRFGRAARNRSL